MMLNITTLFNEILYAILNTLLKITTTSPSILQNSNLNVGLTICLIKLANLIRNQLKS